MWTVDCVAKVAPACTPLRRPPLCMLPTQDAAAEAARFQVDQLRKLWAQSDVAVSGDGVHAPFSCDVRCVDNAGNAAVYHVFVREVEAMVDQLQMEQMALSIAAMTPMGGNKRTKSVMIAGDMHIGVTSSTSDTESADSASDMDTEPAPLATEPRPSCVRMKCARSGAAAAIGF